VQINTVPKSSSSNCRRSTSNLPQKRGGIMRGIFSETTPTMTESNSTTDNGGNGNEEQKGITRQYWSSIRKERERRNIKEIAN